MKVKLLSDGGYSFIGGVKLPAVVEACRPDDSELNGVEVHYSEIARIGAKDRVWTKDSTVYFTADEFEVIHE